MQRNLLEELNAKEAHDIFEESSPKKVCTVYFR